MFNPILLRLTFFWMIQIFPDHFVPPKSEHYPFGDAEVLISVAEIARRLTRPNHTSHPTAPSPRAKFWVPKMTLSMTCEIM